MYAALSSHEDFLEQQVGRCGGVVSEQNECPFANPVFNTRYNGYPIEQLQYQNGLCVAQLGGSYASLGTCNNTATGYGGDNGTLFVDHGGYMINLYWSNQGLYGNDAACMNYQTLSPQASPIDLGYPTSDGCPTFFQTGEGT